MWSELHHAAGRFAIVGLRMSKARMPWFAFYPRDFSSDGKVEAMTTTEVGCYILLLCKAWNEEPAGTLPDDDQSLARWSRVTTEMWTTFKGRVMAPWTLGADGRWHQKRMKEEAARADEISTQRAKAGRASGKARSTDVERGSNTCSTHVQREGNTHPTVPVCVSVPSDSSLSEEGCKGETAPGLDPRLGVMMNVGIPFGVAQKIIRDHDTPLDLLTQYVEMASESHVTNRAAYVRAAIGGGYAPRQAGSNDKAEQAEVEAQEAELRRRRAARSAKTNGVKS